VEEMKGGRGLLIRDADGEGCESKGERTEKKTQKWLASGV